MSFLTARLRPMLCLLPVALNAQLAGPRLSQDLRSALPGLCGLRAGRSALKLCGWTKRKNPLNKRVYFCFVKGVNKCRRIVIGWPD